MENKQYRPRIIDQTIATYLRAFGAVVVEGPKWCGKTWSSEHVARSEIKIGSPKGNFQNRRLAETSPDLVLQGETPRLIDEWQEVPGLWDAVRASVDETGQKGRFILTGSSTPQQKGVLHSGAGRIARIRQHTMTLFESGDSTGDVSLQDICRGQVSDSMTGEKNLQEIATLLIRGGWPENIGVPLHLASLLPEQYMEAILTDDASRIDGSRRSTDKMRRLLLSLARNESTTASNRILKRDIKDVDGDDIDLATVSDYLDVFRRLFLIDDQPPFAPSVRSSVRVKQQAKRHFCDPSIPCALLGLKKPEALIGDLNTMGFLFESLVEHDLKVYAESFQAKLFHYQDYGGHEMDAVIELDDGTWCGIEIKLGANQIDTAAKNLIRIARNFADDPEAKPPAALCVICGLSNAAYRRPDGVYVVPLTALRP